MANRQDSGSNSAHENQRPRAQDEDRLPDNTDQARGIAEPDEDEFVDDETDEDAEEDEEGSF